MFGIDPESFFNEARNSLIFEFGSERTFVIIIASHKDREQNSLQRISCKKGIPIGGYVYDSQGDNYHVECEDYCILGYIDASLIAKLDSWKMRVPIPFHMMEDLLSDLQKKEFHNFKERFINHNFEFLQMIDPN